MDATTANWSVLGISSHRLAKSPISNHVANSPTPISCRYFWSADEFEQRLQGSPIRRIGHERWLRNIAIALGNAETSDSVIDALKAEQTIPQKSFENMLLGP